MRTRCDHLAAAMACLGLAGCGLFGGDEPKGPDLMGHLRYRGTAETITYPDGAGLNLPQTLAGYERERVSERPKGRDVAAEYRRDGGTGEVLATIRLSAHSEGSVLTPFSGSSKIATADASSSAAQTMAASLRAREPGLSQVSSRGVYLLRFGNLQAGSQIVLQGPAGARVVEAFCCVNGNWLYGFEFAVPGGLDPAATADAFVRAVAWSSDPKASVDPIEQ